MICPTCRGRGFTPVGSTENLTIHQRCSECLGSGIVSCCDAAGANFNSSNEDKKSDAPHYTCPLCGAVSYNANDIRESYCGYCHDWEDRP